MPASATASAPAATREGGGGGEENDEAGGARKALWVLGAAIRTGSESTQPKNQNHDKADDDDDGEWLTQLAAPQGHFPPLWAVVTRAAGLSSAESAYVFLLGHAKAVASACVRAGVMGPYQAQALLASAWLRAEIQRAMDGSWRVKKAEGRSGWWGEDEDEEKGMVGVEEAGQGVPAMDLWIGRHELLYSRIFNS